MFVHLLNNFYIFFLEEKCSNVSPYIIEYLKKDPKSININTCSVRMELFIEEALWKSLPHQNKNQLNSFILYLESNIQNLNLSWMAIRMACFEKKDLQSVIEAFKLLRKPNIKTCENSEEKSVNAFDRTVPFDFFDSINKENANLFSKEFSSFSLPLYYISTRDCFAFDLIEKRTEINKMGRKYCKIEFFFNPKALPQNFKSFVSEFPDYRVGVTAYTGFFTHEELLELERNTFETETKCFKRNQGKK